VSTALLVEYFNQLPEGRTGDDPQANNPQQQAALSRFTQQVAARYTEGTLVRLLNSPDPVTRRAALLALGLLGTMESNAAVAARLHDHDPELGRMAADALWSLWFRGDSPAHNDELQRLVRLRDRDKALAGLDQLVKRAPHFAEAYNQRAILLFRTKQYERSIADCEKALQHNPFHFGALAGMGQCFLQLRKHKAALKAFRNALRINPHMDGIAETIRTLENALGEEGRRDDKK
jgi:tetratricopeptide (TPR) repeat protein